MSNLLLSFTRFAQDQIEMADVLRSSGKIYVVVAILVLVLGGVILYLFRLEKKISKLEKEVSDETTGAEYNE